MRIVDADALKAYIDAQKGRPFIGCTIGEAFKIMTDEQPTVDAVPVVHGHWKEDPSGYGFWTCTACGFVSEASAANMLYKFCPVCGARMDGDHEKAD